MPQRAGRSTTLAIFTGAMSMALALSTGCVDALDCGDGTIEQDGVCVGASSVADPAQCGRGTYYDPPSLTCVSDYKPVQCDPMTTVEVVEDGVTICVGVGGPGDCSTALVCPSAAAGKVTVCGRLLDVETGQPIEVDGESTAECSAGSPGPCSLELGFYDASAFASDPQNAPPLAYQELYVDECGRFRATNLDPPANLPLMGIGVDDHPSSGNDDYTLTGVGFPATAGQTVDNVRMYVVRASTDMMWTESAGRPFGFTTFGQRGAYLGIFRRGDTPVQGVTLTTNNETMAALDYYFSDSNSSLISTIDPDQNATGANGAGLMTNMGSNFYGGQGGEAAGCRWPTTQGSSFTGVIFAQEKIMVRGMTGEPCE